MAADGSGSGLVLWLLRHAKTVTDPPEGGSDFDRVLAPRGRRDAVALCQLLGPAGKLPGLRQMEVPQLALVSPAARTAATAELALAGLGRPPKVQVVPDLYGAEPEDVLAQLRLLDGGVTSAMVIGHNPTMHALSRALIAPSDKKGHVLALRRGFPTCALGLYRFGVAAWTEVDVHTAQLRGLFIPPFERK
jgi:phosphohistidine phosphatase